LNVKRLFASSNSEDGQNSGSPTSKGLQHLGIPNLNPRPQEETAEETTMNKEDEELVERMLQHERMVSTMETLNGKVTDMGIMDLVVMKRMSMLPLYRRRTVQDNSLKIVEHVVQCLIRFYS
jgi:hypothetical protein